MLRDYYLSLISFKNEIRVAEILKILQPFFRTKHQIFRKC